jgi:hypothetical protein
MSETKYNIRANVWMYHGLTTPSSNAVTMKGSWYFITIPKKQSAIIKKTFGESARGWGSLRVKATIGKTNWNTSIFPDKKLEAYLLPIKAEVRKKEEIRDGDNVHLVLEIRI